jgi:phosphoketolase
MTGTRTAPPTIARDDAHNGMPRQQPLNDDELALLDAYWRAAAMMNDLDRYHLVIDVVDRVPSLPGRTAHLRQDMIDARVRARAYTREKGEDMPEISEWTWRPQTTASGA